MPDNQRKFSQRASILLALACSCALAMPHAFAQAGFRAVKVEDTIQLSPFGERPAFSPDGKRLAFIGKSYGDAFEIDLSTRKVRNLTMNLPHQGFLRVMYLPNGDFLLTGPRRYAGANSRVAVEMWILEKNLQRGLQPLGEKLFEGIAVSRSRNLISWTAFVPALSLKPDEKWMDAIGSNPMKRYLAEIRYQDGRARLVNKREIMSSKPEGCGYAEPQDFRNDDHELLFYCGATTSEGGHLAYVMGYRIDGGSFVTYRKKGDEYNEAEGIAPDGSWDAVECGKPKGPGLPPIDICRLELEPNGVLTPLIIATSPGSTRKVSNPVVSPDGKWVAFQTADNAVGEIGEGLGIAIVKVTN